ncbi:MAG: resA 8 [Chitinophagaceae bacterium]|nr:resA 8 [Chitinophagaceae bacterium]
MQNFLCKRRKHMRIVKIFIKISVLAILLFPGLILYAQNPTITPGKAAPFIKLKNFDNRIVSFNDYPTAKGFIIIFISNTCPYSKAYEQRIIDLNKKYAPLEFPVIAVNSNDPEVSPGDSFIKMQEHAKAKHYGFAYLSDEKQVVADLYGARSTPHVFIISKKDSDYTVEYTGAIDNDTQNKNPHKIKYAEEALSAILNNQKPAITVTKAISCSISRKKN